MTENRSPAPLAVDKARVGRIRIRSLIVSFVLSAVLTPVLALVTHSSAGLSIVIGVSCFIAIEAIQLSERVTRIRRLTDEFHQTVLQLSDDAHRLAAIVNQGETRIDDRDRLARLARNMGRLDKGPISRMVIAQIIRDDVKRIDAMARQAIYDHKITIDVDSLRQDSRLFTVFRGNADEDYFWATFAPDQISWYRTASGELFLRNVDRVLAERHITEVRRLLVYDKTSDLDSELMALCMYLHLRSKLEVKIISRADFTDVVRSTATAELSYDFGLYGKHYVWETTLSPDGVLKRGNLNFSPSAIERYHIIYTRLWSIAARYPSNFYGKYSCNSRRNYRLGDFRSLVARPSEEDDLNGTAQS